MARQSYVTKTSWRSDKLTDPQVRYIKTVLAEGRRFMKARGMKQNVPQLGRNLGKGGMLTRLANQFNVSKWTIYRISTGERHRRVKVGSLKAIMNEPGFAVPRMATKPKPVPIRGTDISLRTILSVMQDGKWRTLRELKLAVPKLCERTIAARIRDLRKPEFGGYTIERERVGRTLRHQYRVAINAGEK